MKALTDKIIECLKRRRDSFIGSLENREAIANSNGYRDGLSSAIEAIETLESTAEFEEIARVMMKYLANPKKFHPHHTCIITSTTCQLVEGQKSVGQVLDYITD